MFTRSEGGVPSAEDLKDVETMFGELRRGNKTQIFFKIDDLLSVLCEDMTMEQKTESLLPGIPKLAL